jgi:hypothetical protein
LRNQKLEGRYKKIRGGRIKQIGGGGIKNLRGRDKRIGGEEIKK